MISCAQTREFQNNRYQQIDGNWYLVSGNDQKFAIIENTLTLKYTEGVDEAQIEAFEQEFGLSRLRKSSAGWYDYEVAPGGNIFKKCDAMLKTGVASKVEIPTGGEYTDPSK